MDLSLPNLYGLSADNANAAVPRSGGRVPKEKSIFPVARLPNDSQFQGKKRRVQKIRVG